MRIAAAGIARAGAVLRIVGAAARVAWAAAGIARITRIAWIAGITRIAGGLAGTATRCGVRRSRDDDGGRPDRQERNQRDMRNLEHIEFLHLQKTCPSLGRLNARSALNAR